MSDEDVPSILRDAWSDYDPDDPLVSAQETSARVSTNQVYHLSFASGRSLFAKVSSYGSYVHFRQDHARIRQWIDLLNGTRYERFLAPVLLKHGDVYTFERDGVWVVFYEEAPRRSFLPKILSDAQVENLGREMALFHRACSELRVHLHPTWQSLGSDLAALYDQMQSAAVRAAQSLTLEQTRLVRRHCDLFFANAERLGYHITPKIPVLIDWNRGNFSVAYDEDGFRLFSRWDYDWFRIEPRMMDFYFFSRVVREEGDKTVFSYTVSPLLEPRFMRFLRAYHGAFPLTPDEVLFIKEAYRFFVLNYVLRTGEHFFVPEFCGRLQKEAVERYLPELETVDLTPLLDVLS
jgi:hypothetical protein